jgi:protein transport protein SEC24
VKEYLGHHFSQVPYQGAAYASQAELASCDCDKTFGVVLEHDGELTDTTEAYIQCTLLFTHPTTGQRIIRIHTLCLPTTSQLSDIFRYANIEVACALVQKAEAKKMIAKQEQSLQERQVGFCVDVLYNYRKFCASASSSGQVSV